MKLDQKSALWALQDVSLLTETFTSQIYKAIQDGKPVVLKLLKDSGIKDEHYGAAALLHFDGNGAVRVIDHDQDAVLLEFADGLSLRDLVIKGKDQEATEILAETMLKLHSPKPLSCELWPLKEWFRGLFKQAEHDRHNNVSSLFMHAAHVAEELLDNPLNASVLHGDLHHGNILHHKARGWLAIDPKGLYGERTYDAANALCNPEGMSDLVFDEARLFGNAARFAYALKVDTDRLLRFTYVYSALSACWFIEDGQNPAAALRMAEMLKPHIK